MSWLAGGGLPETNWLTFVGAPLLDHFELATDELERLDWSQQIAVRRVSHGVCVRAGARPTLGDVNRGELPSAYIEVARRLRDLLVEEPPEFWGEFARRKATRAWMQRFLEPTEWAYR
jgi:hypothetical protein